MYTCKWRVCDSRVVIRCLKGKLITRFDPTFQRNLYQLKLTSKTTRRTPLPSCAPHLAPPHCGTDTVVRPVSQPRSHLYPENFSSSWRTLRPDPTLRDLAGLSMASSSTTPGLRTAAPPLKCQESSKLPGGVPAGRHLTRTPASLV